ncbi:MAG: hypothetical protein V4723_09100 [Pseudomonadota bacterium]
MTQENSKQDKGALKDGQQQQAYDQGGHQGGKGHGGQQSGGMGGMHGGDLHDVGSGQSGMTGRGGMGGNESQTGSADRSGAIRQGGAETKGDDSRMGNQQLGEIQQSAPREGMGNHRHSNRGNEQALDAAADVDDVGSHQSSAGKDSADKS